MKAIKLSVISAAILLSTSAMANVDNSAVKAVKNTGAAVIDGTKTLVKTASRPGSVSAEVGTLGAGVSLAWSANETAEVVAGWNGAKLNSDNKIKNDFRIDGVTYKLDAELNNPYLGVQVRPAANWLTVGAGIIVPNNDFTLKTDAAASTDDATYQIGNENVKVKELGSLEAKLENRNRVAPYLTVGFRPNINNKWGVFGEFGAAYMGEADVTVTATPLESSTMSAEERNRHVKTLENTLENKDLLKWAPIAKVGATYRF